MWSWSHGERIRSGVRRVPADETGGIRFTRGTPAPKADERLRDRDGLGGPGGRDMRVEEAVNFAAASAWPRRDLMTTSEELPAPPGDRWLSGEAAEGLQHYCSRRTFKFSTNRAFRFCAIPRIRGFMMRKTPCSGMST